MANSPKRNKLPSPLSYKELKNNPTASLHSRIFERIAVGDIKTQKSQVLEIIRQMYSGKSPSRIVRIIGKNGNGKTFLLNSLAQDISSLNIKFDSKREPEGVLFKYMFSLVRVPQDRNGLAYHFSSNLRRSVWEPAATTHSTLAVHLLDEFLRSYVPPFRLRLFSLPYKWLLKKAIKTYKEEFDGIVGSEDADPILAVADGVYKKIQKEMTRKWAKESFKYYSESIELEDSLRHHITLEEHNINSISVLNKHLYTDLRGGHSLANAVKKVERVARQIGCWVVVAMFDECSDEKRLREILNFADQVSEFRQVRVLILFSVLEDEWARLIKKYQHRDRSFETKLNKTLTLKGPNPKSIEVLIDNLLSLMNTELSASGEHIDLPVPSRLKITETCQKIQSYREATQFIIECLEREKRPVPNI